LGFTSSNWPRGDSPGGIFAPVTEAGARLGRAGEGNLEAGAGQARLVVPQCLEAGAAGRKFVVERENLAFDRLPAGAALVARAALVDRAGDDAGLVEGRFLEADLLRPLEAAKQGVILGKGRQAEMARQNQCRPEELSWLVTRAERERRPRLASGPQRMKIATIPIGLRPPFARAGGHARGCPAHHPPALPFGAASLKTRGQGSRRPSVCLPSEI